MTRVLVDTRCTPGWCWRWLDVPRLIGVIQLLLSLYRLVVRLDEQRCHSLLIADIPSSLVSVNHGCLYVNIVQASDRERQQELSAEVVVVRSNRLHHPIGWIVWRLAIA